MFTVRKMFKNSLFYHFNMYNLHAHMHTVISGTYTTGPLIRKCARILQIQQSKPLKQILKGYSLEAKERSKDTKIEDSIQLILLMCSNVIQRHCLRPITPPSPDDICVWATLNLRSLSHSPSGTGFSSTLIAN